MASEKQGRPGRKPLGDRTQVSVKLEKRLRALVQEQARAEGIAEQHLIQRFVAEAMNFEVPSYCRPAPDTQGELPLLQKAS